MRLRSWFSFLTFVLLVITPVAAAAQEFDPGFLIADDSFGNAAAMGGAEGLQRFLEVKGSVLANTSADFLKRLKEPADIDLKNKLDDPNPNLGRLRTAAELMYDAARLSKINPQVILVTLNKEQSLITGNFADQNLLQRHLDRAMGFACPDSGGCGDLFLGFYFQLFGNLDRDGSRYLGASRSLSKSFYTEINGVRVGRGPMIDGEGKTFGSAPKSRIARSGDTITVDNTQGPPYNAPASQTFTLKNSAAATLYRYTPHVYNGNYNFWKFFRQWFKYTNGSLIKLSGSEQVFYVDNGQRRQVSGTVLGLRGLDVTRSYTLSQSEFDEYPLAKPLPPPDGTLVAPSSGILRYIVEGSVLHPISDFVAASRQMDLTKTIYLPDFEVSSYEIGDPALPPDGTLLKSPHQPVVYAVQGRLLRPISGFVFKQRNFNFSKVVIAPEAEVAAFAKSSPLPPLDGTLIKSATAPLIYYIALGQRFPVPYYVFKLRGFKFSSVVNLSPDDIEAIALGQHLAPPEGTLIKAKGNPAIHFVSGSVLHHVSGFMFGYRKFKFASVVEVAPAELALLPTNEALVLDDGTLIKLKSNPTVYVIEDGKKLPLTAAGFKARGYKFSSVVEVPPEEADRYPVGAVVGTLM